MSNYVLLMQYFNDSQTPAEDVVRLAMVSEIGSGLSLISCVMTLSLLCFLPVKTDGLFITGNMSLLMMAAQLSFIGAENAAYPDPIICKTATIIIHYTFLCFLFGSLAYGMHLWTKRGPSPLNNYRKKGTYLVVIWVLPLLVVIATAMARGDLYGTESWCWLPTHYHTRLAFILPLTIILLLNSLLYVVILYSRIKYDLKKGYTLCTVLKHVMTSSLSMMPNLSLVWLLGYSVTFDTAVWMQYLYVAVCSSQGMLLLVCCVLTNTQIQKSLCAKVQEADDTCDTSGDILSHVTDQTRD